MLTLTMHMTGCHLSLRPGWRLALLSAIVFVVVSTGTPSVVAQPILINGGNLSMSITTALSGQQPTVVTNTTASLRYRRQTLPTKITVATVCTGQRFGLAVVAINATGGTPAPQVTLTNGMPATNFITGIPSTGALNKTCILQYTASARFDQGNSTELGNDVHRVTYTLVSQ